MWCALPPSIPQEITHIPSQQGQENWTFACYGLLSYSMLFPSKLKPDAGVPDWQDPNHMLPSAAEEAEKYSLREGVNR